MKKIYLLLCCLPLLAQAQPPAGYYNGAFGQNGENLRVALYNIIKGHTALTYTPGLWNAYATTDVKPNGKLYAIYSDIPGGISPYEFTIGPASGTPPGNQCGSGSQSAEGGCYNREHVWPQSKFGGQVYPMYSDLWIAYPNDYYVNGQRGDLPYGKVTTATKTFLNGSKIGNNVYPGAPATQAFEPIDSFKGDIARTYFYITTRYYADSALFNDWEMAFKSRLKPWVIQMLLEWHHLDPVSTKERNRNNAAYALQNNRNPFIDYPQFADCIWAGNCTGLSTGNVAAIASRIHLFPNPATDKVTVSWAALNPDEVLAVEVVNLQGQVLYHIPGKGISQTTIPVGEWARGLYLLKVHTQHGAQAQKLTVQ